tara:strand:+ start:33 stop:344 length:312 start_codon:yes stop_codon:yes gene_type:complete
MLYIIETTTDDINVANIISESILKKKLSPCIQIINNIQSYYIWDNARIKSNEILIKIKAKKLYIKDIISIIKKEHNYDNPELISYKFNIESSDYKRWFKENTI